MDNDTIVAIGTPLGEGGIGIVRVSGPDAFRMVNSIFKSTKMPQEDYPKSRYLYHGFITSKNGEIIDEVLVAFMKKPYTYTREDVVEINCHSGILPLRMILERVLNEGARLAEPGEFTKRAVINGRIDVSQAESVLSIIRARSEKAVKISAGNLKGALSEKIGSLRQRILNSIAEIEVLIDFPEEESEAELNRTVRQLHSEINFLIDECLSMLKGAERGIALQNGLSTAIIGRPNVGKSSLLNALLRQQRAIVHEMPGTTRDLLEGYLNLEGYPVRLLDTAGIHRTEDPIEKKGIALSKKAVEEARLILFVLDGSVGWTEVDEVIADEIVKEQKKIIFVVNKIDLGLRIDLLDLKLKYPDASYVKTSVLEGTGLEELEKTIVEIFDQLSSEPGENLLLTSIRHVNIIKEVKENFEEVIDMLDREPIELVSMQLRECWDKLGEITGETLSEKLLDRIFKEFCIGK